MTDDYRESFMARNRRSVFLASAVAAVALAVVLYRVTAPKPTTPLAAGIPGQASDVPTLQVGALPVT